MQKLFLIALLLGSVVLSTVQISFSAGQEKTAAAAATAQEGVIKVTITTGGGLYGPVKSQYKVGEEIPVTISMTNTADSPAKYCLSTSLFQNRPELKRDGQIIPYLTNVSGQTETAEVIQRCEMSAARQFHELQPKQTSVVDWFTISLMRVAWYGPLPAGHYELSLRRRIECCQGPMVESNKVTFEIVP